MPPYADRETRLAACRKNRKEHPDQRRAADRRAYTNERKNRNREFIRLAKSRPCLDCGQSYPYYVMDFDHRVGSDKTRNLSQMVTRAYSLTTIQAEIDKCDLVCANCHRERTFNRGELPEAVALD